MKRKSNMIQKCISLVLAESALICVLCSCSDNNKIVDFGNVSQNMEENVQQTQDFADTENDQVIDPANESIEQPQGLADLNNSQTQDSAQDSANESSKQPQSSADPGGEQAQDSANGNADQSNVLPHEGAKECYKAILIDNANFISTDLQNQELNLTEIKKIITDDEITVNITQFAMLDLDSDGQNEIVLWIQINGISDYGFEILRYQNGAVYGYTLPYRELMNLKTDGTFLFSGGAADYGIGKVKFSENGYTVNQQSYSESQYDSNNELNVQYFVNGESCSEEAFQEAVRDQEEKATACVA